MAELVVLAFEGSGTAEMILDTLEHLQAEGALEIEDALIASRPEANPGFSPGGNVSDDIRVSTSAVLPQAIEPKVERSKSVRKHYGWKGSGLGLVAGLILGGPIGGAIAGAAMGGIAGHMKKYGIDDDFAKQVAAVMPPASSAIFLLGTAHEPELIMETLRPFKPHLLKTSLDPQAERQLRSDLEGRG